MTTTPIEISKKQALDAYKLADEKMKPVLEAMFGKEVVSMKITDRIKSVEDAIEYLGSVTDKDELAILNYTGSNKEVLAAKSLLRISLFRKAVNEGWEPNWEDSSESKYFPWLEFVAGVGFSDYDYVCDRSYTFVGSRICFKTSDLARHAAVCCNADYNQLFTL